LDKGKDLQLYLDGIYDSIVLKDIIARKKITDIFMLQSATRFLF